MTNATFLGRATRILFFTGKGGVGKTSLACATAVALSRRGKKVLVVSTDPASNLDEVFGVRLSGEPTPIPEALGLSALNIDPEAAAAAYRERVVGPYRGVFPEAAIASMEEQLSGACTVEIAAFDEFTKLLGDRDATANFDHVIFDTAPTGHTLRLLKLPAAWNGFIATNTTGTSCLGPLAGLQAQKDLYAASLRTLSDPLTTTLVLVSRPDAPALAEADRTRTELTGIGMTNQILIINGLFRALDGADAVAQALETRCDRARRACRNPLAELPRLSMSLLPFAPMGVARLGGLFEPSQVVPAATRGSMWLSERPGLTELVDSVERGGKGVILIMGKGGVGKTTIAAAIAVELAHRGHSVHLTTTDPAAHVENAVAGRINGLKVSRIDPAVETRNYTAEVIGKATPHLDAQGLALLEEDLRSPCTEEIAVFRAFANSSRPPGTSSWCSTQRRPATPCFCSTRRRPTIARFPARSSTCPKRSRAAAPLAGSRFTRVILVTLPEATPVHEAARLQADLQRAGHSDVCLGDQPEFQRHRVFRPAAGGTGVAASFRSLGRCSTILREVRHASVDRNELVGSERSPPIC